MVVVEAVIGDFRISLLLSRVVIDEVLLEVVLSLSFENWMKAEQVMQLDLIKFSFA